MPSRGERTLPPSLGAALRRLRERSGRSLRTASDALGWSSSKLSRIETSKSGVGPEDLTLLLDLYRAESDERVYVDSLTQHPARRSSGASDALPDVLERFTQFEAEASRISMYAALVLPGLLHTPQYAAALINATPVPEGHFAKARMEMRMKRQAIFGRQPPPRINAIIDEAVLKRPIGGDDVMHRQMIRLQELSEMPETTIRILPFAVGAHPALTGPFAILDFPGDAHTPTHVFCDGLTGGVLRNGSDEVDRYRACFASLEGLTLTAKESAQVFAAMAEG